jgi:hypothetical protein
MFYGAVTARGAETNLGLAFVIDKVKLEVTADKESDIDTEIV